jgi:hypothetical protein
VRQQALLEGLDAGGRWLTGAPWKAVGERSAASAGSCITPRVIGRLTTHRRIGFARAWCARVNVVLRVLQPRLRFTRLAGALFRLPPGSGAGNAGSEPLHFGFRPLTL